MSRLAALVALLAGGALLAAPLADRVPPPTLTRLSDAQLEHTLRDLFPGLTLPPLERLPLPEGIFDNDGRTHAPSPEVVEQLADEARRIGDAAAAQLEKLSSCALEDRGCLERWLLTVAHRAFRRPLADDERERLLRLARSESDPRRRVATTLEALVQSPSFLYRVERGVPVARGLARLDSWELASRLSYFLWGTMPDEALLQAAERNALADPARLAAEARRMLRDPRAHESVAHFFAQWLGADRLSDLPKDRDLFPDWSNEVAAELRRSLEKFADHVFFDEGKLEALFVDRHAFVSEKLAPLFGVKADGPELRRVTLDPAERAGLLTQPALLAMLGHPTRESPILRGVFVLERVLCRALPPRPADVKPFAPAPEAVAHLTTRELFTKLHDTGDCMGCHRSIDGIGFGFERYDTLGRFRAREAGRPLDATGTLPGEGAFDGAIQLSERLAASDRVRACAASHWLRWATGGDVGPLDGPVVRSLMGEFARARWDLRELVVAIVRSDAFRFRRVGDAR